MTTQELIKGFGDYVIISLWNRYVDENGIEGEIRLNLPSTINECFSTPYDVAMAIGYGNWNPTDMYFFFNQHGNLISFNYWDDEQSPVDIDLLAGFVENGALD